MYAPHEIVFMRKYGVQVSCVTVLKTNIHIVYSSI